MPEGELCCTREMRRALSKGFRTLCGRGEAWAGSLAPEPPWGFRCMSLWQIIKGAQSKNPLWLFLGVLQEQPRQAAGIPSCRHPQLCHSLDCWHLSALIANFFFYDLKVIISPGCLGAHKENAAPE